MNFKEWINESFDTISDFLLNPQHRHKTWDQLLGEFEASGGKVLGHGSHSTTVFSHPSWNYVLKVYKNDPVYTRFVRFAYKHKDSVFPKFFGLPQKITPEYTRPRYSAELNIVRMEKLYPINYKLAEKLLSYLYTAVNYLEHPPTPEQEADFYTARNLAPIKELIKKPKILKFYQGCRNLLKFKDGALDTATNNIMQRINGDLVFADPFWEGSDPYTDAARVKALETDSWDESEPELFPGGRIKPPKKKKPPKPTQYRYDPNDDVPF